MKRIKKLKEAIFPGDHNPDFVKKLFPKESFRIRTGKINEPVSSIYAIYFRCPEVIKVDGYFSFGSDQRKSVRYRTDFREFFAENNPKNYGDCQFLLHYYMNCRRRKIRLGKFQNPQFEPIPEVEDILKHSRGLLMWQYQLNNLLEAFVPDQKLRDALVKSFMKNEPDSKERIAEFRFPSGFSVADVLEQRMVFDQIEDTNKFGALSLYNYFILEYF